MYSQIFIEFFDGMVDVLEMKENVWLIDPTNGQLVMHFTQKELERGVHFSKIDLVMSYVRKIDYSMIHPMDMELVDVHPCGCTCDYCDEPAVTVINDHEGNTVYVCVHHVGSVEE